MEGLNFTCFEMNFNIGFLLTYTCKYNLHPDDYNYVTIFGKSKNRFNGRNPTKSN